MPVLSPEQAADARQEAANKALATVIESVNKSIIAATAYVGTSIRIDVRRITFAVYPPSVVCYLKPLLAAALEDAGWIFTCDARPCAHTNLILTPKASS